MIGVAPLQPKRRRLGRRRPRRNPGAEHRHSRPRREKSEQCPWLGMEDRAGGAQLTIAEITGKQPQDDGGDHGAEYDAGCGSGRSQRRPFADERPLQLIARHAERPQQR